MRNGQLVRVLRLQQMIQHKYTCTPLGVLAEALGVSTRTIRRDLEALSEAHIPVPPFEHDHYREREL